MSLDELEKRINDVSDQIEKRFDEVTKQIEERFTQSKSTGQEPPRQDLRPRSRQHTPFWGIALIAFGIVLLNNHFSWFELDVPILPAVLIILGAYLIFENHNAC
ncbi:MAG: hypothetical protein NTW14_05850 [bacterium]|nr:hypothetical protein [bacterium]